MTPEDYLKQQKANKKIFELYASEAEKKAMLAKMMELEREFMLNNLEVIQSMPLDEQIPGYQGEPQNLFMRAQFEKVTPENFSERVKTQVSCEDGKGPQKDLITFMDEHGVSKEDKQELIQAICDMMNKQMLEFAQQYLSPNNNAYKIVENDDSFDLVRNPEGIDNPSKEVDNIVKRAHQQTVNLQSATGVNRSPAMQNDTANQRRVTLRKTTTDDRSSEEPKNNDANSPRLG